MVENPVEKVKSSFQTGNSIQLPVVSEAPQNRPAAVFLALAAAGFPQDAARLPTGVFLVQKMQLRRGFLNAPVNHGTITLVSCGKTFPTREVLFMNNWLNQLERKYGRFGIPNLTNILVGGQILVLAIELFVNQTVTVWLAMNRYFLLHGQIWRAITFVFIPFSGGSILSAVLGIYFTWFIGTALEREWGDFRYTVYLLSGMLGTVLACLLTGVTGSTYCLSLSLLLAFAMLYPEVQVLLFFVIPIRVKYFGFFAAVLWVLSFLGAPLPQKLSLLLSMANVWLFFGPMAYRSIRAWVRREQWKRRNRR